MEWILVNACLYSRGLLGYSGVVYSERQPYRSEDIDLLNPLFLYIRVRILTQVFLSPYVAVILAGTSRRDTKLLCVGYRSYSTRLVANDCLVLIIISIH